MRVRFRKQCACVCAAGLLLQAVPVRGAVPEEVRTSIESTITLAELGMEQNTEAIRILLEKCLDQLEEDDPAAVTIQSILTLLDTGQADSAAVTILLKSLIDGEKTSTASEDSGTGRSVSGLPVYQAVSFVKTVLSRSVLVNVPGDWGNNASGRAMTSYSSENASGAISPSAATLTLNYFQMESGQTEAAVLDEYEKNIAGLSVTTQLTSQDATAADLSARKLDFTMQVGANRYTCETVCFAYASTVYTIELMQGQQSALDYFSMYDQVVDSAQIGSEEEIREAEEQESFRELERQEQIQAVSQSQPDSSSGQEEPDQTDEPSQPVHQSQENTDGDFTDIGAFTYELNGHRYQFPTQVRDLSPEDLMLDRSLTLPYDFLSDADMAGEKWTELVNTQCYYFENSLYKEMAGVTNMNGYPSPITEGILTALMDTQGTYVDITLPGGVKVGSPEQDILKGFPEFSSMSMDGIARFRGNELLYACNIRDDGCSGYALIRNDAPFYSAVTMICENGVIKEISFECIGSERAKGVFL